MIAGAVVVTVVEGVPGRLPGVALGSAMLLHVERAGALAAIAVALISILAQATGGRLPTQLSTGGLSYEADAARDTEAALADLQGQVADLEDALAVLAERVDDPQLGA